MSKLSESILDKTSKGSSQEALLVLEDGTSFRGRSCGAQGEQFGEICFNTSLEGYLEVISDPSYAGQILVMTYPQIGNYGVNPEDVQRDKPALRGLVVHDLCKTPSNWRSKMTLEEYLTSNRVVAIEGVDTRALVRHIRDNGAMRAGISTETLDEAQLLAKVKDSQPLVGTNLVETVSAEAVMAHESKPDLYSFFLDDLKKESPEKTYNIVAIDCGAKDSILFNLERMGANVTVVPWDTPTEDILAMEPDGIFLSNGPGDPDAVEQTYDNVGKLIGKVPMFGICLGHQMLSKAAGADMEKLTFGHRGGNHPVMNLLTGRVEITAQNHSFSQRFDSLGPVIAELSGGQTDHFPDLREWVRLGVAPVVDNDRFGRIQLTHVNLNDGTPEGMAFLDVPAFSVQYHPEASPGPTDAHYLFTAFGRLIDGKEDYLDIDIAEDRLEGWRF